jgi:hypothetical protein
MVERNVLEWRLDPDCAARLPTARYDLRGHDDSWVSH